MRKVIVNSTPLIILSRINHLSILKELYEEIIIPQAVFKEVTNKEDFICRQILKNLHWIKMFDCKSNDRKMYQAKLHAGEVEVMILAQELNADLIILDDNAAKKTAKYLGLNVTGTLGVLLKAKRENLIESVQPLIKMMLNNGFYLSDEVIRMTLSVAEENNIEVLAK